MRRTLILGILLLSQFASASTLTIGRPVPLPGPVPAPSPAPPALVNPTPPLAEKDAGGHPLFYYGKVFVQTRQQMGVLDFFRFRHSAQPFFDEFDPKRARELGQDGIAGTWEYAIASGSQWNVLYKYDGLVKFIQLNPRSSSGAHPLLDAALKPDGSIDAQTLAGNGFTLNPPPKPRAPICNGSGPVVLDFWDDLGDVVEGVVDGVADFVAGVIKKFGGTIADVMRAAYQGVSDAIDFLRQLGNAGYCALAGKRYHSGKIFVTDPKFSGDVTMPFGANKGQAEPIRYASMHARGGVGGILLTETSINEFGDYQFNDLCGDLTYTISLQMDAPQAWITYNGYSIDQLDLGSAGPNDQNTTWHVNAPSARWLLGTQIAAQFAREFFKFVPGRAKIELGTVPNSIIGGFSGGVSITACGQASLVTPLVEAAIPILGTVTAPMLDADIFGHESTANSADMIGKVIHEYGHYTMCRAIDHYGGDLQYFLNAYVWRMLTHPDKQESKYDWMRNTAESFADYFTFNAIGYTDYFANDRGSKWCAEDHSSSALCIEPDASFLQPAPDPSMANAWVGSRTSVMFDWTDTGFGPWGFSRRGGLAGPDDDTLALPSEVLARAVAHVGAHLKTENLSAWISSMPEYGKPADALCRVYKNHGWTCDGVNTNGAELDAPTHLDGVPVSTTDIDWSWVPQSELATRYSVLDQNGNKVVTVDANNFEAQAHYAVAPNTRVVASVESERDGAVPGRSARVVRCTLAAPVTVNAQASGSGITLSWPADAATDYAILRADGTGDFAQLTVQSPGAGNHFTDGSAVPGIAYQYRVDGRNCDGWPATGVPASAQLAFSDAGFVFVRSGAQNGDGTRSRPVGRIADAMPKITAQRNRILVAEGTYPERVQVASNGAADVVLVGGYDSAFTGWDANRHPVKITGDASDWDAIMGPSEFRVVTHPVIYASGPANFTLESVHVLPNWGAGCSDSTYCRPGAFLSGGSITLTVRNVEYRGASRPNVAAQPFVASLYDYMGGGSVNLIDSTIAEPTGTGNIGVWAGSVNATNSLVVAGAAGTGIKAASATVVRSVIRGGAFSWEPAGSIGLDVFNVARISNSIIGADIALKKTSVRDNGFNQNLPPSILVNSVVYGQLFIAYTQVANDILVSDHGTLIQHQEAGQSVAGIDVRHNVFIPYYGSVHIAQTKQRDMYGMGFVDASGNINDPNGWFRDPGNRVEGNLILTIQQVTGLFNQSPDPRAGTPEGHVWHPLPGALFGLAASTGEYGYGPGTDLDLDGNPRPFDRDIGPYADQPYGGASCRPKSCADLSANCGSLSNGCDSLLSDCGSCWGSGQTCGGGGMPNQCGCTPKSCADLGANCGNADDGCGGILSCGTCSGAETCGGAGQSNVCGVCVPRSCAQLGAVCGTPSDGCGGTLSCGGCNAGEACSAGQCVSTCKPKKCRPGLCGEMDDGCGGTLCCGNAVHCCM